jgi:hypothetical protein
VRRLAAVALLAVSVASLTGCGSVLTEGTSDAAGLAGAGIAGAVTNNATVGAAIGLGVKSVADFGLRYVERDVHAAEQDRIAAVAGALPDGGVGVWSVSHSIPIEADQHGEVASIRSFGAGAPPGGAAFSCKDIVFSVDHGAGADLRRDFYTATVCLDGTRWKWALAEPATARWGNLQ